ncbi:MAG: LAGLIDADG family homing endonuclease [Nanoarchaeota archaeon]
MAKSTKDELAEQLEELESHKGRHTEFISVYVPADVDANLAQKQLEAEKSTAKNIKSTTTRNNVNDALDKIIRELKTLKRTPENGLALFAGNVSKVEGQVDLQLWVIEPPQPLKIRLYRCDKDFVIEPLKVMLEVSEVFGLLVMDRKEATIGLLEGKRIEVLQKMTSGIPSKIRAGGQCLSPDTLIMKDDGEIIEIKDSHNPLIVLSENFNQEKTEKTPIIAKWENNKELFRITTCYPKIEVKSSAEHTFFMRTENGIEEKALSEIKEGDYLIMPEKINLELEDQEINFSPEIKQAFNMKSVNIPKILNEDLAKLFGYYLGDGSYELDRISFSEQREELAKHYQNLTKEIFGIDSHLNFRTDKNYYQIRIYSRIISQLFKQIFSEKEKTLKEKIPSIILKSSDNSLAGFISGFFDAEGYVSGGRVAFGINNPVLAKQFQFALLRLGIISSINTYDNNKNPYSNNIRYTLAIDDIESLKTFQDKVNFTCLEKRKKLKEGIQNRSNRNKIRQLIVNGKDVARIIRNTGLNTRQFGCPDFFNNKKQISKEVFKKNILDKIVDDNLKRRLELFYNSNLILVKIAKIESLGTQKTIDIETKNHNFLANCLVVHNSSQRFHRITEGLTKDFYKRIAEEMKKNFYDVAKLKGIIVGGPIPTKDEFLDGEYLVTQLQNKVIGRVDIGGSDESGLRELVDKARPLLEGQEIVHEQKVLEKFFETLGEKPDLAYYKEKDIRKALEYGAVDLLIISKTIDKKITKELMELAKAIDSKIEIVSTETTEGEQFNNLSGIGAILRFKIQ